MCLNISPWITNIYMVELTGIEPVTSWLPVKCSFHFSIIVNHWYSTQSRMASAFTKNCLMSLFHLFHTIAETNWHIFPKCDNLFGIFLLYKQTYYSIIYPKSCHKQDYVNKLIIFPFMCSLLYYLKNITNSLSFI